MEWTREKRYLPYNQWSAETLLDLQAQAANSAYQMHYHLRPISGLVNDPNGFSYFNGEYHVFYQSYPFGAVHGLKSWVHFKSRDLVNWQYLGTAVKPDTMADSHGAYSGSATQIGDKLFLMYTGNHRDQDWVRTPYQIGAWMDQTGHVSGKKILIKKPANITEHFRDPQIIKQGDHYYVILGAQDEAEKHGHIDVWETKDLENWHELGFLDFTDQVMGYMIECPNLVNVDGHAALIFCPQGLDKSIADYQNIYPNMTVVTDKADLANAKLINPSPLQNLDDGFDVYATQAFNAPDGKAYAISWVGLPDTTYPTDNENWANCLSQVKELHYQDGKLLQTPVAAMAKLRHDEQNLNKQTIISNHSGQQYELKLEIAADQTGSLKLAAKQELKQGLNLIFDTQTGKLTLDRSHAGDVALDHGTSRTISLPAKQALDLDIFVDHSLIEIFVNGGEHVLTARFFTDQDAQSIYFDQDTDYQGTLWQMNSIM